jgi:superfamily I DNA and/or RNA helicase
VIKEGLKNSNDIPKLLDEITQQITNLDWKKDSELPPTIEKKIYLKDHPKVTKAFDNYLEQQWLPTYDSLTAWSEIQPIYNKFFSLYKEQSRLGDEYELVLSLGLLTWQGPSQTKIRRHLIVANVFMEFNSLSGEFVVRPHLDGAKLTLEFDMLDATQIRTEDMKNAQSLLLQANDNPWEKEIVGKVLKSVVHSLHSEGTYNDSLEEEKLDDCPSIPIVSYAPALILRQRSSKSLTKALENIKENISNNLPLPSEFARLIEEKAEETKTPYEDDESIKINLKSFENEIYFPKPANNEQFRIATCFNRSNGVVVQGPPGTGKSHTIANLICHLLSTGQRILVTTKTATALKVIHGLLPKELSNLCINLLGNGIEEQNSLTSSVSSILINQDKWDKKNEKDKYLKLKKQLQDLKEEQAEINHTLLSIAKSEFDPLELKGIYSGTAAQIAEKVNQGHSAYQWLSDSVPLKDTSPISPEELLSNLKTLRSLTPEIKKELSSIWPESLPSFDNFSSLVKDEQTTLKEQETYANGSDKKIASILETQGDSLIIKDILNSLTLLRTELKKLSESPYLYLPKALDEIIKGHSALWRERLSVTREIISLVEPLVSLADLVTLTLPERRELKEIREDAVILYQYLEKKGKLGFIFFRPKLVRERRYLLKSIKINGKACSTAEDFLTLSQTLSALINFEKVWSYWKGSFEKPQGPYSSQLITLNSLRDELEQALKIGEIIEQTRVQIHKLPELECPVWLDKSQIDIFIQSCLLVLAKLNERRYTSELGELQQLVLNLASNSNAHPVVNDVLKAINERNIDLLKYCYSEIKKLEDNKHLSTKINNYLNELQKKIPNFVDCLKKSYHESYWEDRIKIFDQAWHWAQARSWLKARVRKEDSIALNQRIKQIEAEVLELNAKIAANLAWSSFFSRLEERHRQHLVAWQQAMKKLGKGTGKSAPGYRREAQNHLNSCRQAVPAWIMPLHRVYDTISTKEPGIFDVIIVDEASQCGLEAVPLLYLCKKILIVGDDQQITPQTVRIEEENVKTLQNEYLKDFKFKISFDKDGNLFDIGKINYNKPIILREHFRCMPEIIQFSNELCYAETPLLPLRQYGEDRLPPLDHVFVSNGFTTDQAHSINEPEANEIVKKIAQACQDKKYDDKSMGVIVLKGEKQAAIIQKKLLEHFGDVKEIESRKLLCGNAKSFQGDERDIIFLSLVDAPNTRTHSLTSLTYLRRYNVAASRARDRMVLFHSITAEHIGQNCLRRKLLDFFLNPRPRKIAGLDLNELELRVARDNRSLVKAPKPFDSWFEVDVALELVRRKFLVVPQYNEVGKKIDLAVVGGQSKLAVECDGDYWHGDDQYENDMQRQRLLERCGWRFFRILASEYYTDKVKALEGLWLALEEEKIFPQNHYPAREIGASDLSYTLILAPSDSDGLEDDIEGSVPISTA